MPGDKAKVFYGKVAKSVKTPTESDVLALNNAMNEGNTYTYKNVVIDSEKIVYAYPSSLGDLKKIVDNTGMGFDLLSTYTQHKINITVDTSAVEYNVYIADYATTIVEEDEYDITFEGGV